MVGFGINDARITAEIRRLAPHITLNARADPIGRKRVQFRRGVPLPRPNFTCNGYAPRGNAREMKLAQHLHIGRARSYQSAPVAHHLQEINMMNATRESARRTLGPTRLSPGLESRAVDDIASALTVILADMFALYIKTKNFHWHVSGAHFRDYHLLFDEQSEQILAATDAIAERVRKIGGSTLHSIGHIARIQRVADNDEAYVSPEDMLEELLDDNSKLAVRLRGVHELCDERGDIAGASLIENWIDEAERRAWFLHETTR
jgi:starvation-inducible DNA-binding protein